MTATTNVHRDNFEVEGLSCRSCAQTVAEALTSVNGVREAEVDHHKEQAMVTYDEDPVDSDQLKKAVDEAGYQLVG